MIRGSAPALSVGSHELELLSPAHSPEIYDLFRRCEDFFVLQDGEPPVPADADELFSDVPPSKRPEDQHVLGFRRDGKLDALAALLVDYPDRGSWYVGLLIVDPIVRGQGLGREIYSSLEGWASKHGARRILAGIVRENVAALRFWRSIGFEPLRIVGPRTFKGKAHLIDEFARQL